MGEMPWPKIGKNHCHAKLEYQYKCRAINGLVVYINCDFSALGPIVP